MDELSLLDRIRTDVPQPVERVLDEARAALLTRAEAESAPRKPAPARSPRRPVRLAGFGALTAGALTVALVASNVLGFAGWRGGAEPAAAAALDQAALATITTSDPVLLPGQFLLVETDAVYGASVQPADGDGTEQSAIAYLTISKEQLYIPADPADEWVWVRPLSEPYETFSPEGAAIAAERYEQQRAESGDEPELLRASGGEFYGSSSLPDYSALPRDPQQLLDHIYEVTQGQGRSRDGEALVWIADTLRSGHVPADLRAALYRAVAGIPGVEITEQAANLEGVIGISIGRVETVDNTRQDILIDPATGSLIGERRVALTDQWGFPAGTTQAFTAVRTSVVDVAPAGGTPNGRFDRDGCTNLGAGSFQC